MAGSKNARRGSQADTLACTCGGEIRMRTKFESHKMKTFAECVKCGAIARKPKDLMGEKFKIGV